MTSAPQSAQLLPQLAGSCHQHSSLESWHGCAADGEQLSVLLQNSECTGSPAGGLLAGHPPRANARLSFWCTKSNRNSPKAAKPITFSSYDQFCGCATSKL